MQTHIHRHTARSPSLWLIAIPAAIIALILLWPHSRPNPSDTTNASGHTADAPHLAGDASPETLAARARAFYGLGGSPGRPEEIVAGKVSRFGQSRREIVRRIARRANKEVPPEVEKFFDALESGSWEEIDSRWRELAKQSGQYQWSEKDNHDLDPYWSAVLDAYGVAEQAHNWGAQKLLDYGNSILSSLRPGMAYVGGTDDGRWIPELLNETSDGEPHIIITQNALADSRYLDYVQELYGDRLDALTRDDSQQGFTDYVADARKRLEHDQKFPNEPKQIRPGEQIVNEDDRVQVSGETAVMGVNEKLLLMLMAKNPDLHFAIQESQPMPGTYAGALPLGHLMELGAVNDPNTFTAERASQSLEYWRSVSQQLLADPGAGGSQDALKAYSHDTASAGNLLAAHNFTAEAEQAYRLASQVWPENPDATGALANLLARTGRETEARQLLEEFNRKYPNRMKDVQRASGNFTLTSSAPTARP